MCLAESCSQTSQEDQPIPDQTSGLTQQRMTDISFNNILKKHTVLVPLAETNIRFRSYSTKLFQWTSKMFRFIPIAFSLRDVHKLVNSDRRPLSHWTNNKSESQIVKTQRRNFKWAGLIENTSSAHSYACHVEATRANLARNKVQSYVSLMKSLACTSEIVQ